MSPCYEPVYEFLPPITGATSLESPQLAALKAKWGSRLSVNVTDPIDFLRNKNNLIYCQLYIQLSSPESKPALETVLEMIQGDSPHSFQVFVLLDPGNTTAKKIVYSYRLAVQEAGAIKAVEYLVNGFTIGFEQAYKKLRLSVRWRSLQSLMSGGPVYDQVSHYQQHFSRYNIARFTITVNGQIIRRRPAFREIKEAIREHARRIMDFAQRGELNEASNFFAWVMKHGLPMDTLDPPLVIDLSNRVSLEGLGFPHTKRLLGTLTAGVHSDPSNGDLLRVPVYFIGDRPKYDLDDVDISWMDVRYLDPARLTSEVKNVLRIPATKTLVGGLAFSHILSAAELR
jgi:hypothetical protein